MFAQLLKKFYLHPTSIFLEPKNPLQLLHEHATDPYP